MEPWGKGPWCAYVPRPSRVSTGLHRKELQAKGHPVPDYEQVPTTAEEKGVLPLPLTLALTLASLHLDPGAFGEARDERQQRVRGEGRRLR